MMNNEGKEMKEDFYQSKFDYYSKIIGRLMIVSTIAYLAFFVTDCQIFGRFANETFIPRIIIVIPLTIFLILYKKIKNYKIIVPATYLMIHIIIWCTDWATYILPDRSFASEGMIVMNLIFLCAGYSAPFYYSTIAHALMLVDIIVADMFIHYDSLTMMILFNLPCIIAICIMNKFMENGYMDHYLTRKQLEKLVVHDQLTSVYNRNKLKELSYGETEEFNFPKDMEVCILIIDIDFFKKVNDVYGHEAGDVVLKNTAKILKNTVRASDYIIRWGGEEFVIIMQGCSIEAGMSVAEKIRKNIEISDNGICKVTASIGVSLYEGGNYHDAIGCADKALYKAKSDGRNRVVEYIKEK